MNNKGSSLLQETYIQKSKLFLLPLTGLKKNKYFKETNTYVSSPDLISADYPSGINFEDEILIVTYSKDYKIKQDNIYNQVNANFKNITIEETGWDKYETTLITNKKFIGFHESLDEYLYTFDLHDHAKDWTAFMKGRYTQMSSKAKEIIKKYRWEYLEAPEARKLYCYLYANEDETCFKDFAEDLGILVDDLMQVKELCSKPNLRLETYVYLEKKHFNEIKS